MFQKVYGDMYVEASYKYNFKKYLKIVLKKNKATSKFKF